MQLGPAFVQELEHESLATLKTLERVPESQLEWSPHPKSMSLGILASHLASIPIWGASILESDSFDLMPSGVPLPQADFPSVQEMLGTFNAGLAALTDALAQYPDAMMAEPWTLLSNGQAIFTAPRAQVIRTVVISHLIHHRAQLGVYLRLLNVEVPSSYGPTADEAIG